MKLTFNKDSVTVRVTLKEALFGIELTPYNYEQIVRVCTFLDSTKLKHELLQNMMNNDCN